MLYSNRRGGLLVACAGHKILALNNVSITQKTDNDQKENVTVIAGTLHILIGHSFGSSDFWLQRV